MGLYSGGLFCHGAIVISQRHSGCGNTWLFPTSSYHMGPIKSFKNTIQRETTVLYLVCAPPNNFKICMLFFMKASNSSCCEGWKEEEGHEVKSAPDKYRYDRMFMLRRVLLHQSSFNTPHGTEVNCNV